LLFVVVIDGKVSNNLFRIYSFLFMHPCVVVLMKYQNTTTQGCMNKKTIKAFDFSRNFTPRQLSNNNSILFKQSNKFQVNNG